MLQGVFVVFASVGVITVLILIGAICMFLYDTWSTEKHRKLEADTCVSKALTSVLSEVLETRPDPLLAHFHRSLSKDATGRELCRDLRMFADDIRDLEALHHGRVAFFIQSNKDIFDRVHIFALSGPMGVGKSSVSKEFVRVVTGKAPKRLSVAAPLKDCSSSIFHNDRLVYDASQEDRLKDDPYWLEMLGSDYGCHRKQLTSVGDLVRGGISPWIWIMSMVKLIYDEASRLEEGQKLVYYIDDLRFKQEALLLACIKHTWHVELSRKGVIYTGTHNSEMGATASYADETVLLSDVGDNTALAVKAARQLGIY